MTETDTLHLWYKPYGGVMGDGDVAFVERYGRRFYPKAMVELAKHVHRTAGKITRLCKEGTFEFQMRHYTKKATGRYVIEETLRDAVDYTGLSFGIQEANREERKLFSQCFADESGASTSPVANVIAYLEDSISNEHHRWQNARLKDGQDALPVLLELIAFLKAVKNVARVYTFECSQDQRGIALTLALVCPGVLSYYTRIDWIIA